MAAENKAFGELFAEKKNELDHLQQSMASIIPAFPGQMTAKYFDLAIGIDFHSTIFPPSPLLPVPHIGMVFDIMGAIMSVIAAILPPPPEPPEPNDDGSMPPPPPISILSVATAVVSAMKPSVKVHGQWIANAGTGIQHLPGIFVHLPFPIVAPMASSEMWMGSSSVLADGGPCSTQFHPALSCNLIGFPSLFRMNKPPKPKMTLMAPTSMLMVITSGGAPVLVGGPPTIDLFQLMFKMALKGMGKLWKKGKAKVKKPKTKTPELGAAQPKTKCNGVGEPVDVAAGKVYSTNTDFELPGPIPLVWDRTYYSNAEVDGPIGYNWHHSYNMGIYDMQNGFFTLRLDDGREVGLPALALGEIFYNRVEQFSWQRDREGYLLLTADKLLYRFNGTKNREGFQTLSSIQNASENSIQFFYDTRGRLQKIIDSSNRILKITNNELGYIECISTKLAGEEINLVQYQYDAAGNMIKTLDAKEVSKDFFYEAHLLVKLRNQSGMHFYWEYEGKGNDAKCIHTWGDESILEYWLQYEEGKTTARNSLGHATEYFYDDSKLIYKIVDANGGVTHQTYNDYDELASVINPEGHAQLFTYNDFGKLVKLVNENEEATTYKYDAQLNLTGINTPGGMQVQWKYDDLGRITERTNADGNVLKYIYNSNQLTWIEDHKGRRYSLNYDAQQNLRELTLPNGKTQQWNYDELGRLLQTTNARGLVSKYKYDELGNVIWMQEPDGNEHQFSYDASGNLEKATDDGHKVEFTYGAMGVLQSRTQNNATVNFAYDTELQLRSIANEGGEVYKFGLDANGNVVSEWGFDGMQRRYVRDGNGRVQKVLRPAERWTAYDYDGTGNIVKEEHYDGSIAAYRYNKDGMLLEAFNEDGQIILQRDSAGRVVTEKQGNYEVNKKYDADGNCILTSSNLGAAIAMQFDDEGNVIKMNAGAWEAGFKRDEVGLELHRQMCGGVQVNTERDNFGRVIRRSIGVGNAEQSRVRYDWAKTGQRLNKTVNELTKAQTNYEYDAFDNLISAAYDEKGTTETVYRVPDKIGNLFKTKEKSDRKYSKGGRLMEDEKYFYHYDAEGNIIFKEFKHNSNELAKDKALYAEEIGIKLKATQTGWAYEWAGNGMLRQVINPGGKSVVFSYDPLGRRIAKQYKGVVTRWVWDGNIPLHEWRYEGGFPQQHSINDSGEVIEEKEPVENLITWLYENGSFVPCGKLTENESYSIIADYLGTPTHAYNSAGKKVWERELDCYGKVRKLNGEKDFCHYLYQGQSVDEETGLAYNRFRYYDNESGNYLSQDPIGLEASNPNIYAYVHDPNTWTDPLGLDGILTISSDSPKGDPIGHAFISVTENGKTTHIGQWPNPGFAKSDIGRILVSDMGGALDFDDVSHLQSKDLVSKSFNLDGDQMKSLKQYIKDFDSLNSASNGYNLRSRQCASFAYGAAKAAGIKSLRILGWVTPSSLSKKIKKLNAKSTTH
jgi:RHS repeat-associated protein